MKKLLLCLLCCVLLVACTEKVEPERTLTVGYENMDERYKNDEAVALLIYDATLVTTPVTDRYCDNSDCVIVLVREIGSQVKFFQIWAEGTDDFTKDWNATYAVSATESTVIRFGVTDPGSNSMWYLQVTTPDGEVYGSPIPFHCETEDRVLLVGAQWDGKERLADGWGEEIVPTEKPVIYFYPQEDCLVDVYLDYAGELSCTYPAYRNGWSVTARTDGTLIDDAGQEYQYLYWEGEGYHDFDFSRGFCVAGEDTAVFLETALEKLGLNRREANEFIVYWLPQMQNNAYNVISFQKETYEEAAKLHIQPEPDTLIRVFMAWYGTQAPVELPTQNLTSPVREGFTVVEWGGAEINPR